MLLMSSPLAVAVRRLVRPPWRHRSIRIAVLGVAVCAAAAANAEALRTDPGTCADLTNGNGLLPDEVTGAWQCDAEPPDKAVAVATAPAADGKADARLMLIVGVSSGAGWLARGFQKE